MSASAALSVEPPIATSRLPTPCAVLDPHGACGYQALKDGLRPGEVGIFCETAHPAKFKEKVDQILGTDIDIPERLQAFMRGEKQNVEMSKDFQDFKQYLLKQ